MPTIKAKAGLSILVAGLAYYMGCSVNKIEIKEEGNMSVSSKIASNIIKRAPGGPDSISSTFGELWKDHTCVIVFFRRFG